MKAEGHLPCSVVILTLNEERNLAACLQTLSRFDDIHVLDSGSTDSTAVIAARHGAQFATNPFAGFGKQRNWAHDHLPLRHPWVLHLDADERMNAELASEVESAIASDTGAIAGFMLAEKTMLHGRWLRHAGHYPRYQVRLVHPQRMRYVDHGHGQRESSSLPFGVLSTPYEHLAFSHGLEHWLRKHVGYAAKESQQWVDGSYGSLSLRALLFGTPLERHRTLKRMAMSVPLRPYLRFLHILIAQRGFLDGRTGWEFARMMLIFEQMIDLLIAESRNRIPASVHQTAAIASRQASAAENKP